MYRKILLSLDPEDALSLDRALPAAVTLAKAFDSELHVVTVVPDLGYSVVGQYFPKDFADKMVGAAKQQLRDEVDKRVGGAVPVELHLGQGSIYSEVLHAAQAVGVDLIVIGAHRPGLKDFLLGPNAARVVRHAGCSVLVVRDD